jgi:hypothetical protein
MYRRSRDGFVASMPMFVLGAIFLVPLSIGVLLVSSNASQYDHANQISRDVASMYAQGLDFSKNSNQSIAMRVAEGLGMPEGQGVIILSRVRVVHDADCREKTRGECANNGRPVVTQRYVIGNGALRYSSLGTPANVDSATGEVPNWAIETSARAQDFSASLKAGEFAYVAECYLTSPEHRSGVYARAVF